MIFNIVFAMIALAFGFKGWLGIAGWFMAFLIMIENREKEDRHYEGEKWIYYPSDCLVKPTKYQFLFKMKDLPSQGIAKEDYYARIINFWCFCIITIIGIFAMRISQKASAVVFISYIFFYGTIEIISLHLQLKKTFYRKFKKLNIYNLFYYIIGGYYPVTRKIGKCKIISEYQKGKYTYVEIEMLENGKRMERVIFSGVKKQEKDPIYTLYEICKVYYII